MFYTKSQGRKNLGPTLSILGLFFGQALNMHHIYKFTTSVCDGARVRQADGARPGTPGRSIARREGCRAGSVTDGRLGPAPPTAVTEPDVTLVRTDRARPGTPGRSVARRGGCRAGSVTEGDFTVSKGHRYPLVTN